MTHRVIVKSKREEWTAEQIALAAEIWQREVSDVYGSDPPRGLRERVIHNIAARIDRKTWSVARRLSDHGPSFGAPMIRGLGSLEAKRAPPELLVDREHRARAATRRTLTQVVLGDPPPGYSALDRLATTHDDGRER
jgi:hypothetical protein